MRTKPGINRTKRFLIGRSRRPEREAANPLSGGRRTFRPASLVREETGFHLGKDHRGQGREIHVRHLAGVAKAFLFFVLPITFAVLPIWAAFQPASRAAARAWVRFVVLLREPWYHRTQLRDCRCTSCHRLNLSPRLDRPAEPCGCNILPRRRVTRRTGPNRE